MSGLHFFPGQFTRLKKQLRIETPKETVQFGYDLVHGRPGIGNVDCRLKELLAVKANVSLVNLSLLKEKCSGENFRNV